MGLLKNLPQIARLITTSAITPEQKAIEEQKPEQFYRLTAIKIDGKEFSFNELVNKHVLVVNTASACGFTNQYRQLEELYENNRNQNLEILAFPCDDFGGQEPGVNTSIAEFCDAKFKVSFHLFSKIKILGNETHPVYVYLLSQFKNAHINWNFEKILISPSGLVIKKYSSWYNPLKIKIG